jgi:hypothetical protein
MMDTPTDARAAAPQEPARCAECGTTLFEGQDRQVTDDGTFCRPCFDRLTYELERALGEQGRDINYPMAVVGGLAGAAVGVAAWWGFTVLTNIAFGLVAVVIGFATGKGVAMLSGGKRHVNLQVLSVAISIAGFAYASYLVNRTFLQRAFTEQGQQVVLPWLPDPGLFFNVVSPGFGVMDVVFLAIVVWEAWKIPAPIRIASPS